MKMTRAEFYLNSTKGQLKVAEDELAEMKGWLKRKVADAESGFEYVSIAALAEGIITKMGKVEELKDRVQLIENVTEKE